MHQHPQPSGGPPNAVSDGQPEPAQPASRKARPKKTLPTNRVAFGKQLDVLHAHAVLSNEGEKPATNMEVAKMVGLNHATVSLVNPFFADVGLLVKSNGSYLPSREVIEFSRARQWGDEGAGRKLGRLLEESWFSKAILRSLAFSTTMSEEAAHRQLAQEASAGTEYRSQLAMLLGYMEEGGLIVRDGSQIQRAEPVSSTDRPPEPPTPAAPANRPPDIDTGALAAKGGVQFQVSVHVDMAEMAGWEPDRINAFFSGIAKALAAKGGLEQDDPAT